MEEKMKALLEGLECQDIKKFMKIATVEDYRNFGAAYLSAVRCKIKESNG